MMLFLLAVCFAASVLVLYYVGESLQWDAAWSVDGIAAEVHLVAILLSVIVYVRLSRGVWIGVNDAYGMAIVCVIGAVLAAACALWAAVGLYPAAATAGAVLSVVACVARLIVPRGIRLIRLAF